MIAAELKTTGQYQPYPEYKDSGVAWLGNTPSHWAVFHGKRLLSQRRETAKPESTQLAASQAYGVIPQSLLMEMTGNKVMLALKGTENFKHVSENDFVISLRSFEGGIEHSTYSGCVSPAYTVLQAVKAIHPWFYRYLFKSSPYIAALQASTDSLRDGKSITFEQFGAISLPLPSPEEQCAIAAFLDYETARIDRLIAQQQRLIELLKEKRQAVISQAVTKGLNPDAPMKDSGVEWLGQVPEHWSVVSLKYLVQEKVAGPYGASLTKAMYTNSGYRVYGQQQVINDDFHFGDYFISEEKYAEMKRYQIFPDDVLVSVMGTIGKVAVVPNDVAAGIINPRLVRYKFSKIIKPHFVQALMMSVNYQSRLREASQGSTMEGLNMGILGGLPMVYPCINEQDSILKFVLEKNKNYSSTIDKAEQLVALAQERRTALISAAVTGKIDLRGWEPPVEEVAA